jgi:hypothetical protein
MLTAAIFAAQAPSNPAIKNVTGHYRFTKEEFRNRLDVKQLAGGKIKFHILTLWVSHNNPETFTTVSCRESPHLKTALQFTIRMAAK